MAILKDFECVTGAIGNYWKITKYVNTPTREWFELSLYKDKAARDSDKTPMTNRVFYFELPPPCDLYPETPFTLEEMNKENMNYKKIAYNWLKTQSEFTDCKDI